MSQLRIAIDKQLTTRHAPEVHWTWRLLLSGMGWAWQEVPAQAACDIAYVTDVRQAPKARLCIRANPAAWARPASCRLGGIERCDGVKLLRFADEGPVAVPLRAVNGQVVCHRDVAFDVFWLACGQEEQYWPRDRHGFFDLAGTALLREQGLRLAMASQIGTWLQERLLELGCQPPMPRWPHGKRAAASVGHDVDYPEVIRWLEPLRVLARQGIAGLASALDVLTGRRHHWHFPEWVEMEERLQARSAFYFVARRGSLLEYAMGTPDPFYDVTSARFRELFRYLTDHGFEVGLQASYNAYRSSEQLAVERQRLQEASGQPILGNHHHYWHLDPGDAEQTLLFHEQVGLRYDCSLVHDRYLGWRRGLAWPFFPFHHVRRRELKTLQIPTAWMDDHVFGQRAHNPGDPWESLRALADCVLDQGGCLHIDVHDYVFDDALYPGWAAMYRRLWEYLSDRGAFWFAAPARIAEHWTQRYDTLVEASRGLKEGLP